MSGSQKPRKVKPSKIVRLRAAGMSERKVTKKTGATPGEIKKAVKRASQDR